MHRELTVKEIITFCAELRLPKAKTSQQKHELVNNTIGVLGEWANKCSQVQTVF
jgi:hypothetical protein